MTETVTSAKITKAEKRARAYADQLEAAGWQVTVRVTVHEPNRYSFEPFDIMTDGFTHVFVFALREWYGGAIDFSFYTNAGLDGRRATTGYQGGEVRQSSGATHNLRSEKYLASWVHTLCIRAA